jgi:hypothetical protein
MTTAQKSMSPRLTANPAAIIVGSLGIGTHMLSSVIRMKTPSTPMLSTTSTAKFTRGSVIEAVRMAVAAGMKKELRGSRPRPSKA